AAGRLAGSRGRLLLPGAVLLRVRGAAARRAGALPRVVPAQGRPRLVSRAIHAAGARAVGRRPGTLRGAAPGTQGRHPGRAARRIQEIPLARPERGAAGLLLEVPVLGLLGVGRGCNAQPAAPGRGPSARYRLAGRAAGAGHPDTRLRGSRQISVALCAPGPAAARDPGGGRHGPTGPPRRPATRPAAGLAGGAAEPRPAGHLRHSTARRQPGGYPPLPAANSRSHLAPDAPAARTPADRPAHHGRADRCPLLSGTRRLLPVPGG